MYALVGIEGIVFTVITMESKNATPIFPVSYLIIYVFQHFAFLSKKTMNILILPTKLLFRL